MPQPVTDVPPAELTVDTTKPVVRIATTMPPQHRDRATKLAWLDRALGETDCDLFITPQEWLGGHYVMPHDRHIDRQWVVDQVGGLARSHGKHVAVGACCTSGPGTGATEDFLYLDDDGALLGWHSKFALPSYDDVRAKGHGQLWPETSFEKRATPINLPKLRLRVGTMFCWEVFSQLLWSAYSFNRVNLVTHPIKFAPRGWLKNETKDDGLRHIVGFGNAPQSQIWVDRLVMAGKHQVMCPIAAACNSWDLGPKFMALVGHVDELRGTTDLHDLPAVGTDQYIHTFDMVPEWYEGIDHHHSAGAFKQHVGSVEGFSEMGAWTMHGKIRRLEAHLIGGTTRMDCMLKAATASRQKPSTVARTFGKQQKVRLPKKPGQP